MKFVTRISTIVLSAFALLGSLLFAIEGQLSLSGLFLGVEAGIVSFSVGIGFWLIVAMLNVWICDRLLGLYWSHSGAFGPWRNTVVALLSCSVSLLQGLWIGYYVTRY